MRHVEHLQYGSNGELALEFATASEVRHIGTPRGAGLDDPLAATSAALVEPLEFPPLAEATVAGDKVVLALSTVIPEQRSIVKGAVQTLVEAGVDVDNIMLLVADDDSAQRLMQGNENEPDDLVASVQIERHDPRDRMGLAYLAATESGHAVYMNRHICDADLVITIGCVRPQTSREYLGIHGCVYPWFADIDTWRRFQSASHDEALVREVDEAGWLLGARFTIQLIPGGGTDVLHILAGDVDAVNREAMRLSQAAWSVEVDAPASLVIAAVSGAAPQQTWQNLYRALEAASRVVKKDGAIVLCTELDRPLDESALRSLARRSEQSRPADADSVPALEAIEPRKLLQQLRDVSLFLVSDQNQRLVEDLGMVSVSKSSEVANLCRTYGDCLLLSNAQHAWPEIPKGAASTA